MRRRLKRLLLGLLLLAGLFLLASNLFLNTPLGPRAFSRRPERFRIAWTWAWSLWPGRVNARGLQVFGSSRNTAWSVTAERAHGRIDLPALFSRTFRLAELHGEGVRSWVRRGPDIGAPPKPSARGRSGRRPWTLRFDFVTLDHVREFRFNDVRLTGDGHCDGAFQIVLGGNFKLETSKLRMPAAHLNMGADTIAQSLDLQAEVSLGPYVIRQHPGVEGFDFLSGSLRVQGKLPELAFLARPQSPRGIPGTLSADLQVERGHLKPGSRFSLVAAPAGANSPFRLMIAISRDPAEPLFYLTGQARELTAGRRKIGPPLFQSASLSVTARARETRLSRIFATARDLRAHTFPATLPLIGDVRAEGVRIEAPSSGATLRASFDRAAGRVDLAGLLARRLSVDGLVADGVSARLDVPRRAPSPPLPGAAAPWSVRLAGARFTGIREIGLGDFLLAGNTHAETTLFYDRNGTLTVERAAVAISAGSFRVNGEPAAQNLALKVEAHIEPLVLAQSPGLAALRSVSASGTIRGRISSLGFLGTYFVKTPWLAVQGQGGLTADVKLERGLIAPGSRLSVSASPVRVTIFDSLATGQATVDAAVEPAKTGARTSLRVRFQQFGLADTTQKGRPAYLRGRGLQVAAVAPGALDLSAPAPDFDVSLDMPDAEVPDLSVYNALIPEETGLSILSSPGRVRLQLKTSTATHKAQGSATLTSDAARIQFQNLELGGRLKLSAPLVSPDLVGRRFNLKGLRLELDGGSYHDVQGEAPAEPTPWWMRAELDSGSLVWGAPLLLRGEGRIDMKSSGPLLLLFTQRSRFLRWFDDALNVENVTARGVLRLGNGEVEVESLRASGGPMEVRTRMIFSKVHRRGDLYIRYGRFAAGVELRDGQRSFKLRKALEWFESRRGAWASP